MTREEAYKLVEEMIKSPNLRKHALAVEAIMISLAKKFGEDEEEWGIVGLLHDGDYELVEKDPKSHTLVMEKKLREWSLPAGRQVSDRIINAIKAHHDGIKEGRDNNLEKAIYASDELSGLITAVTLVRPDKKLASVTVESVMKKFPEKNFAAGAKREQILACESELNIPLKEFVEIALKAMQGISDELGL